MARAHIGTSGFYYDHWKDGVFYPQGLPKSQWLEFYTSRFDTVELNNTFYRLPREKTFQDWHRKSPPGFVFSLKGSRFISHVKKFKDPQETWGNFYNRAKLLEEKLGPVLFQTPPSWRVNLDRLKDLLAVVPSSVRLAFEFRHPSWFKKEVYQVLEGHQAGLCWVSSPDWPTAEVLTADFVYLRFHGQKRLYSSNYSGQELKEWADKFGKWLKEGRDVYAYFNNDALGYAPKNAETLMKLVEGEG